MSEHQQPSEEELSKILKEQALTAEIPTIFHKSIEKGPFSQCLMCETPFGPNSIYLIEKSVMSHDVKYEYAMCYSCAERMNGSMSKESRKCIDTFYQEHVDINARARRFEENPGIRPEELISNCLISGEPVHELEEYHVFAQCIGDKLVMANTPYMLSMPVMEQLNELLSPESKGERDRFIDDFLGLPPELRKLLKEVPVMV
ncbi:MAG: hypothetical protein ACI959_000495 [Limisphaerales bacterium]